MKSRKDDWDERLTRPSKVTRERILICLVGSLHFLFLICKIIDPKDLN